MRNGYQWARADAAPMPPETMVTRSALAKELARRAKLYAEAVAESEKASEARMKLDAGSSRARITTANARWSTKAEHRDHCERNLIIALEAAGLAPAGGENDHG